MVRNTYLLQHVVGIVIFFVLKLSETEVRDFEDPPAVNQAVVRLEVAVALDVGVVQVAHPPHYVPHQARQEHLVQVDILIF